MIRILLIEDNPADASLARAALAGDVDSDVRTDVVWVKTLANALVELAAQPIGCVVLDLGLPDGEGIELIDVLLLAHPDVPVVVLTGRDDTELALEAVRRGAQDYLLKSEMATRMLRRAVIFAVERVGIRAELARNEAHYRAVVESLGEGLVVQDADGRIRTANPQAARILGLSFDEVLGRVSADPRWRAVDENDRPLPGERHPAMVAFRTGEPVVDFRMGIHPPTGEMRWIDVSAFPMSERGQQTPYAVVSSFRDITAVRAASQQMRFQASLLDAAGQAIIATDPAGTITYWNHAAETMYGWAAEDALGHLVTEVTPSLEMEERAERISADLVAGHSWTGDFMMRDRDGRSFPALVTGTPIMDEDGRLTAVIRVSNDITERKQAAETMRRLSGIVESSGDAIISRDLDGSITSWNEGAEQLYGYSAEEAIGRDVPIFAPHGRETDVTDVIGQVVAGATIERFETTRRCKDGRLVDVSLTVSPTYDSQGAIVGASTIARDITSRKEAERALAHHALHDTLTGLPNRTLLEDRLEHALDRSRRSGATVCVILANLDDFKDINISLGRDAGDEVLLKVAERLASCVRMEDTLARVVGDTFAILVEATEGHEAAVVAERIVTTLSESIPLGGGAFFVHASMGIATGSRMGRGERGRHMIDSGEMMVEAELAMHEAKLQRRGHFCAYTSAMQEGLVERIAMKSDLERGLRRKEFLLHYQPIVSILSGAVVGSEALVRWQHPQRGLVPPMEFIPVAEQTGMIIELGRWVLQTACVEAAGWPEKLDGSPAPYVSVNVAGSQLQQPGFVEEVLGILERSRLPASRLVLEMTESSLIEDTERNIEKLKQLQKAGVSLAIDDFGTGYSSLSYLRRFGMDILKIDKSFVDQLGPDAIDSALVTAMVGLGANLGMKVIAEGIELPEQLADLRSLHCDLGQGYLFSRPVAADEFEAMLLPLGDLVVAER